MVIISAVPIFRIFTVDMAILKTAIKQGQGQQEKHVRQLHDICLYDVLLLSVKKPFFSEKWRKSQWTNIFDTVDTNINCGKLSYSSYLQP